MAKTADKDCGCSTGDDTGAPAVKFHAPAVLSDKQAMTPEGYLCCYDVPIARTGMMLYGADEVPELEPQGGIVRVDREPDQVFRDITIKSFEGKPVTNDHPEEDVTSANWKRLAVGTVQNVRRGVGLQDNLLLADLLITDKEAIEAVRDGKREVSCGYDAKFEQTSPGRGRQLNILGNHVALVDKGRCGARCAIKDKETTTMTEKSWKDRLKAAFTLRDEKAIDTILAEGEGSGSGGNGGGVHVHIGATATDVKPRDKKGSDEEEETTKEKLKKAEDTIAQLRKDAEKKEGKEGEETEDKRRDGESEEEYEERKKKTDKAKDSASLLEGGTKAADVLYSEVQSRAEILAPGVTLPRLNAKIVHDSAKVADGLCLVKRAALTAALNTDSGKTALKPFIGDKAVDSLSCAVVDAAFIGASEVLKVVNNSRAHPLITDANGNKKSVSDAWKKNGIDKINAEFWKPTTAKKGN